MKTIQRINENFFSLNNTPFVRNFQFVKDGLDTCKLVNIFDQDEVLFENQPISEISVNGDTFENIIDLQNAFNNLFYTEETTPKPLVFEAFLTQSGTNAPEVAVLIEDTVKDVSFNRNGVGYFSATSPKFENGKVIVNGVNPYLTDNSELSQLSFSDNALNLGGGPVNNRKVIIPSHATKTGNSIFFATRDNDVYADDVLSKYNAYIKITVFV